MYRAFLLSGVSFLLVFAPVARGAVRIWSITPVLLIELLLVFAWLWRVNNRVHSPQSTVHRKFARTEIDLPIALFVILAVVSAFLSVYKHDSIYAVMKLFGYVGVYYLVVNEFDREMIKRLLNIVIFTGAALSLCGIMQYADLLPREWWVPKEFLAATYVNHNHFAGYLELVIPVVIGMIVNGVRSRELGVRRKEIVLVMALVMMMAAFILAQSRGAWCSLGFAVLVMIAILGKSRSGRGRHFFMIFVLLFITFLSIYLNIDLITQRIDQPAGEASLAIRMKIWRGSMEMLARNPFTGTGIGTFIWAFPRFRPPELQVMANFAHNDYLQMAAEMGLAAPAIMLWIFISAIRRGAAKGASHPVRLGCAMGALSLAIHGITDFNFHITANMLLFTVYLAVIMKGRAGNGGTDNA
ncbi:MAG: O-antigen ligase family protein [Candidatus Omnitrophota bacterium]